MSHTADRTLPQTRLRALILCLGMVLVSPRWAHAAEAAPPEFPLALTLDTLETAPPSEALIQTFYRMDEGFMRATIHVGDRATAERFARALARLMVVDTTSYMPMLAARMAEKFPHPAETDALLEVVRRTDRQSRIAHASALAALVALHEPRVVPLLGDDLLRTPRGDQRGALQLLAQCEDPRALALIRQFNATQPPAALAALARDAERDAQRLLTDHLSCAFNLDDTTYAHLARQGFVVRNEGKGNELYEFLGEEYPCVTSDMAFHAFVLVSRAMLGELDSLVVAPRLASCCTRMTADCARIAAARGPGRVRDAALRDAAFFAVGAELLGRAAPLRDDRARDRVQEDLALIRAHAGVGRSAVLDRTEDFAKYAPRGRMSESPALAGYAAAVTWLGRGEFAVDSAEELRAALTLVAATRLDPHVAHDISALERLLEQFYGPTEDLTLAQLDAAVASLPGTNRDPLHVASDDRRLRELQSRLETGPRPRITTRTPAPESATDAAPHGFVLRVFGQRYTRAIDLLQQEMSTGTWPPHGVDLAASLLGSARAAELARETGVLDARRSGAEPRPALPAGTGGLPEAALVVLSTLFRHDTREPASMRGPAWEEKQINTSLAAWAEVSNVTTPFVKDANEYLSASAMTDRIHGWVEPVPTFYASLDSLTSAWMHAFDALGAFAAVDSSLARELRASPEPPVGPGGSRAHWTSADMRAAEERRSLSVRATRDCFTDLSSLLERLRQIAERELRGDGQTIDDGVFLKGARFRLKYLAFNRSNSESAAEPMAVLTDVASEYASGQCLEVGTGRPRAIYVAVHDGSHTYVCRGAVYSYYEFVAPVEERLDAQHWKALVVHGGAPPAWMDSRPALAGSTSPVSHARR
jgi:hypothetical protein